MLLVCTLGTGMGWQINSPSSFKSHDSCQHREQPYQYSSTATPAGSWEPSTVLMQPDNVSHVLAD